MALNGGSFKNKHAYRVASGKKMAREAKAGVSEESWEVKSGSACGMIVFSKSSDLENDSSF